MPSNSETILSNQNHPGDSSSQSVTGEKFRGDGYYGRSDGLHTVQFNLTNFTGTIKIEATLDTTPEDTDYFDVELSTNSTVSGTVDTTGAVSSGSTVTLSSVSFDSASENFNYNFTGNFVWVRAIVSDWTAGNVDSILLNH